MVRFSPKNSPCLPINPIPSATIAQFKPTVIKIKIENQQKHWKSKPVLDKIKCLVNFDKLTINIIVRAADKDNASKLLLHIIFFENRITNQRVHKH